MILFFRSVLFYLLLLAMIRLMGKRQIGQMEPSELAVTMVMADLAAAPMQDGALSPAGGLIPMLTVLALEVGLSLAAFRWIRLRQLLCGRPVILIENGRLLQENLRRTRITLDELTGHLRQKAVLDISRVQYAILETDGTISVFPFPAQQPPSAADLGVTPAGQLLPVTLISDGHLLTDNLILAKKDGAWLRRVLQQQNTTVQGTCLLTVDRDGRIVYIPRAPSAPQAEPPKAP